MNMCHDPTQRWSSITMRALPTHTDLLINWETGSRWVRLWMRVVVLDFPLFLNCRQFSFMCMFSDSVDLVWCQVQRLWRDPRSSHPWGFCEKRILHYKEQWQTKYGFKVDPNENNYQRHTSNSNPATWTRITVGCWPYLELHPHLPIRARQEWKQKEVKTQHRRGLTNRTELWRLSTYFTTFLPPCAVSIESSFFQQVVVKQWLLEKKSHTSRLDNKTGALAEGGCCRCAGFRPRNERPEGAHFENHHEHDTRRTARLPITSTTQWYSVLTFIP